MSSPEAIPEDAIVLRLVRDHSGVNPEYCNNFVVQADGAEVHLRFYQVNPPVVLGDTLEEKKASVEDMDGKISATCVAHIVFSKERMLEFLGVLNEHAAKHIGFVADEFHQNGGQQS